MKQKLHRPKAEHSNLRHRFIMGVLAPPFFVLVLLGTIVIWQLNGFVRNQAVEELNRAANTTASKLEREFALRRKVLERTGDEIFAIKSNYQSELKKLGDRRAVCSTHLQQKKTFNTAPDDACEPFLATFAKQGANAQAVEDGYVDVGQELAKSQKKQINERLTSYSRFFPETIALIVTDDEGQIVSSALSPLFENSADHFADNLKQAKTAVLEGQVTVYKDLKMAVFAYPTSGATVLAAYDLSNENFLRESWESTPINTKEALAVILDSQGKPAYPGSDPGGAFEHASASLRKDSFASFELSNVVQIGTATEVEGSKWLVAVVSPRTVVFAPVRDAQIAAVLIIGGLLVGFLWAGSFFIQRTLHSIIRLVSGALVFATGKLDYQIDLTTGDEEFISLAGTMNSMAKRIATAEKEIDEKNKEFISIATHELRTPLTAIKGNLSMVFEDMGNQLDASVKPLVEQAFTGTNRLATLVNDMLDMARLDGNRVEFVIAPQDIQAVALDVTETLQITAREKSVMLSYDPTTAQPVLADASKLRIVLNNFVSNAIKYNRLSGAVKVFHSLKDGKLVTAVADNGLGIPEDQKAHMFEKFFRVQNDDRKDVVGTGLGMYITREYVVKMGGEVWFESTHGKGSTFYFSLPLAKSL